MECRGAAHVHAPAALALILSQRLQLEQHSDYKLKEWKDLSEVCQYFCDRGSEADQKTFLGESIETREEVSKWLSFANDFQNDDLSLHIKLQSINEHLLKRAVLVGRGLAITLADIAVFVSIHDSVARFSAAEQEKFPNLIRWFDYIQNKENGTLIFDKISIGIAEFEPGNKLTEAANKAAKSALTAEPVDTITSGNSVSRNEEGTVIVKAASNEKLGLNKGTKTMPAATSAVSEDKTKAKQKKEKIERPAAEKAETDVSISTLDIRVGKVINVWKHPSADTLLVEQIDLGENGIRQVVSGLAKYISVEEMLKRMVVVITNVKPGKLRDVMSSGLVLCASTLDHSIVEPLMPPEAAVVGERVSFSGFDGKPEDVLNPKKKQLERILPDLFTDATGLATYRGIPFMTSAGPCKSAVVNGSIK
eukprot:c24516_g1_i1 orf=532-1794(-)